MISKPPNRQQYAVIFIVIASICLVTIGVGIYGSINLVREVSVELPATAKAQELATEEAKRNASNSTSDNLQPSSKTDLEKFQGTWIFVSDMIDGRETDIKDLANIQVIVTGETYIITEDGEIITRATFKIDPSQHPKSFDVEFTEGPAIVMTSHGIYRFQGETITLCAVYGEEKSRPREFTSKPGTGDRLIVYRKVEN